MKIIIAGVEIDVLPDKKPVSTKELDFDALVEVRDAVKELFEIIDDNIEREVNQHYDLLDLKKDIENDLNDRLNGSMAHV